jgi:H+-translocating NAD(P) transhydrogenase subunit alpha
MRIITLNPREKLEQRISLTPQSVQKLSKLGFQVVLPEGLGAHLGFSDEDYKAAGAQVNQDIQVEPSDLVVIVKAQKSQLEALPLGVTLIGLLDPFQNPELIGILQQKDISSFCMELIPRTTYAQKMDALSSQASLAGYVAVIKAADVISKVLPMMSTPAGTIPPAKVFVLGVGVAGLQAIATAKRLGARVEAYDTRPVVAEQVQSLGAKFITIDVGDVGQTEQGYAQALTEEQLERQRQQLAKVCAGADIVITTAQVFGRAAPRLLTKEMVQGMRAGSVIVDLAAASGGNVEGTVADKTVDINGVKIIGLSNFPSEVAKDASQMYASNVVNLLEHIWNKENQSLNFNLEDDIIKSVLLTYQGQIRDARVKAAVEGK